MKLKSRMNITGTGVGKLATGVLVGGIIGATVGWLTAPASGAELRRYLRGEDMDARKRAKTAVGNIESQVRVLAQETSQ